MRFVDRDIKLTISGIPFKAYLEDSQHYFDPIDQKAPFVPTSWPNDSVAIRMMERVKYTFNVFSENRRECVINYRNLYNLIGSLKPAFRNEGGLFLPRKSNLTGYITVGFSGMPNRSSANIHLTAFSYEINKEMGFLQVPTDEIKTTKKDKMYDTNMKLIPLAYTINIEGKIIQSLENTIRVGDGKKYRIVNPDQNVLNTYKNEQKFKQWLENLVGVSIEDYNQVGLTNLKTIFDTISSNVDEQGYFRHTGTIKGRTQAVTSFNKAIQEAREVDTTGEAGSITAATENVTSTETTDTP